MKYVFLLACLYLSACSLLEKEETDDVLARVHDKYLYKSDVTDLLLKLNGEKDSATILTNYINNWVQQELLLQKAELNLTDDQKNFQKLLEDYRRSLIIYAYQKEWITQQLDTNVKMSEISNYYEENQANFELKENIIRMRYVKVARNAPKLNKLEKMMQEEEEEERNELREYCVQYAIDFNENDSVWVPFDDVLQKMPIQVTNEEDFLKQNHFVITGDSLYLHMMWIRDYKIKSSTSPLSFESDKIRNIIINQRKLELLGLMKKNLFESAIDKGNAEIYTN